MLAMADSAQLRIDLLGVPLVRWQGAPLVVDTRKAIAVLALLAVAESEGAGPVSRSTIATMLWPEADETRARGVLRRTLSVLLAATGDAVVTDRATVSLAAGLVTSDVITFRQLARSDDRNDLARAAALVRGEFVSGLSLRCGPFEDWAAATSQTLSRELGAVLERLVLERIRHGERHAALADAARWLELDPLHEPAHRALMRLLAWTGRRQDALDQYGRCVRLLGDALGIAPVRATTEVFDAIRTGRLDPPGSARPRRPSRTDAPAIPMVGRDSAMATLLGPATAPGRAVVLIGESGVGRSRLVDEFAAQRGHVIVARAHSGEAALSLAPVADLVRAAVARIGTLPDDLAVELARLVPEVVSEHHRRSLPDPVFGTSDRFYDAVVRVIAASAVDAVVVEDVHLASTSTAHVLTYLLHRLDRIGTPLVLTWRSPGLPHRHPVHLAMATGRLAEVVTTLELSRLSRDDVTELIRSTESPLDVDDVLTETAGLPLLVVGALRSGGDALTLSVRELLAARLAEVSEETAQVLAALAVHGGVVDPVALRSTSGRGDVETIEAVEEALSVGLIREEGSAVSFTHDALRRVSYDGISLVRRRLLHARAAEWLMSARDSEVRAELIAHHFHEAGRDEQASTWAWAAATRSAGLYAHEETLLHLEAAVAYGRDDTEVALAAASAQVALARYEQALVTLRRAASLTKAKALLVEVGRRAADVHARRGEWELADSELRAALNLLAEDGPVQVRVRLLADRALVASRSGDLADATELAASALAAGGTADPYALNVSGVVALAAGATSSALQAFETALALDLEVGLEAAVLNNVSQAQAAAGSLELAVQTARQALEMSQQYGDRHRLAALHANLADRLHDVNAPEAAMSHLKLSAALFAEVGADPLDRPEVWTLSAW